MHITGEGSAIHTCNIPWRSNNGHDWVWLPWNRPYYTSKSPPHQSTHHWEYWKHCLLLGDSRPPQQSTDLSRLSHIVKRDFLTLGISGNSWQVLVGRDPPKVGRSITSVWATASFPLSPPHMWSDVMPGRKITSPCTEHVWMTKKDLSVGGFITLRTHGL